MKANYTKPLLAMELFTTSQGTSLDCLDSIPKKQVNFNDPYGCGWDVGGGRIYFLESGTACNTDGEGMSGVCYNNPSEGNYIFRS